MIVVLANYIAQVSAHFLQASAQALQSEECSACLVHSAAQASQHFTHSAQIASANCEPLAHNEVQRAHISAQSLHNFTHSIRPSVSKQLAKHFSHATTQATQASIQL